MTQYKYDMAKFSAGDVTEITGVSRAIQRVWRSRGILPPLEGTRAKFTPLELARIYLASRFTSRAFTHEQAAEYVASCLADVVYWSVAMPLNAQSIDAEGRPHSLKDVDSFARAVVKDFGLELSGDPIKKKRIPLTFDELDCTLDLQKVGQRMGSLGPIYFVRELEEA